MERMKVSDMYVHLGEVVKEINCYQAVLDAGIILAPERQKEYNGCYKKVEENIHAHCLQRIKELQESMPFYFVIKDD